MNISGTTSTCVILDNVQFIKSGLTTSYGSSITVTDEIGMDVSNCFNINTSITTIDGAEPTDTLCNTILQIEINIPVSAETECNYTGYTKQLDGLIILEYPNGVTNLNVHPDCCNALGFTPKIGDAGYYVCEWGEAVCLDCCDSFVKTNSFDGDGYMIYNFVTGGTTTVVAKAECCWADNLIEINTTNGFHCMEPVVRDCGNLTVGTIPIFGDVPFYAPNSTTPIYQVEFSECCTINGFSYKPGTNGKYICYVPINTTKPTVSITNDACCKNTSIPQTSSCLSYNGVYNGASVGDAYIHYNDCDDNSLQELILDSNNSSISFCAKEGTAYVSGNATITGPNGSCVSTPCYKYNYGGTGVGVLNYIDCDGVPQQARYDGIGASGTDYFGEFCAREITTTDSALIYIGVC